MVSQDRLGSGSRILASSLGVTARTSVQERPVGRIRCSSRGAIHRVSGVFKLHSVSLRIVHWSLFVVELGECIDPGDKLVYGVAEILTPTVGDEKDFIFKVEAAPISPSDLGSVGMLARFGADSIAVGEAAFTVTVPFPQALEGMFKADGDMKPVGNEGAGVVVAAGSAPEAQDLLGKRVSHGRLILCAVHQDQPQQSHVRSVA